MPTIAHDRTDEESIITAIRKTLTATAVVGAVLAGSAACGTVEQISAGQKLDQAFGKLGKEKTISFELDLDTDARSLKALDASSNPEPGEEIPHEVADLLSDATISVTAQSKKPIDESGEKDFVGMAMKVRAHGGDIVEYRVVGDYTYIRSDAKLLGKAMGTPVPSAEDLPPEAGGLKKALDGEWVKINTKEMAETAAEPGTEPVPEPTLDARTQKQLLDALRKTVAREVDFETADGEDGAERITATAPFRTLVGELLGEIRPLAKKLPPGMELPTDGDLKEVPDAEVTADFTLKNGELSEVYVDLAELAENVKVKKLGLVVRMTEGQTLRAPAGATELDIEEMLGGFGAAMMGTEDSGEEVGLPEEGFPVDAV
ncbi:hypothetical protein ACFFKE_31855 [Streptomyces mutabilis]|uniref:hypothetical protein n=1 Tax=Streptomyces mutabilis TaxID=67332 RepID=UPI001983C4BD|nr:hypothetical protein [Streptomyces mutabilis]GGQ19568.1 hypothetical protein GCM10010279_29200 [Streptomyces mutabilis]